MPPENKVRFAGYPTAFVFDAPDGKKIQHLIWGNGTWEDDDKRAVLQEKIDESSGSWSAASR